MSSQDSTTVAQQGSTVQHAQFRLLRLILIDSYSRNRTVEVNLDGHLTLTGENGGGKTTLLRLIPIFFGDSPSRVIQSDDNNHSFGRHYFPTTSSYIVFEYERRGDKVLSVIHPDGQSDGVIYRFIDSPYRPELFRDAAGPIQSRDFTRHLTKLGVEESKALTLTAYRNILHNTAGRDQRQLANRFAFTGSGGQLTHIERVITAILQRATTFYDLKRMIVSSVQDKQDAFSMRTGKRELLHWIAGYEAHQAVMACVGVMDGLERDDALRRAHEMDFARIHACLQLLHDHYQNQVVAGEQEEKRLAHEREGTSLRFTTDLQTSSDNLTQERSALKSAQDAISGLLKRKKQYEADGLEAKAAQVDAIPGKTERRQLLSGQLATLEGSVQSITAVFDRMANEANTAASAEIRGHESCRTTLLQEYSARTERLFGQQREETTALQERHRVEAAAKTAAVSALQIDEARLETQSQNPPRDPQLDAALTEERAKQASAVEVHNALHEAREDLDRTMKKCQTAFLEAEEMLNGSENAVERIELEMQGLIDAGNAGENTLLGFLRENRPDWHLNIGRLLSEETLLRADLAPHLSDGDDLYGVAISVDKIPAGRLTSEASIQAELQRLKALLTKRRDEIAIDRKALTEKAHARDRAKTALDAHSVKIAQARQSKQDADRRVQVAGNKVEVSLAAAKREAVTALESCRNKLKEAKSAASALHLDHVRQSDELTKAQNAARQRQQTEHASAVAAIDAAIMKVNATLLTTIAEIGKQRDASLQKEGIDVAVLNGLRSQIEELGNLIKLAHGFSSDVLVFRTWLEDAWAHKEAYEAAVREAERRVSVALAENQRLLDARKVALDAIDAKIVKATEATNAASKNQRTAAAHMHSMAAWPKEPSTLAAGHDPSLTIEGINDRRRDLQRIYDDVQKRIRDGVDEIRRAMMSSVGTGPEKCHNATMQSLGVPMPGKEYLWIEGLRSWFNHEHATNRADVIQLGKTMALNISSFWKGLGQFKKDVANFASDLRAHLHQGKLFANISDVSALITTEVDKQGYWQAIENLHFEFEAWHSLSDNNLPPASFIDAAREVAAVISDDRGLVADPIDLISLQITANIDGDGSKIAKNEAALARMSSNGLSYVILCFILLGFINRIRRKESVQIPYPVDELRDLSTNNATALLNLLAQNNVTLIAAFPDVDPDLAPLFDRNYKIQTGRVLANVLLDEDEEAIAHV